MRVGIIGLGTVGRAVRELFDRPDHEVVGFDVATGQPYPRAELSTCDLAVVCVDTPFADGAADVSRVRAAVHDVPCAQIVIKSTVPPGTTDQLAAESGKELCYWPEYISESSYHNPWFPSRIAEIPFVILGGPPAVTRRMVDRLLPILGPTKTYYQCPATEAELIKYAENAFFATKITFVNEFRRLSEAFGADWHTVREGWLLDPRVERMHTAAMASDPGFDGKCLPKDLAAIVAAAAAAGYDCPLLTAVQCTNDRFRKEPLDA